MCEVEQAFKGRSRKFVGTCRDKGCFGMLQRDGVRYAETIS
jgi:hypothetical protein